MHRRIKAVVRNLLVSGLVTGFIFCHTAAVSAATSCNPGGGITTVGLEWVAKQCIAEGMTDNTSTYYINNMVQCSGSAVTLYAPYGDAQSSPAAIINYAKAQGYKVFRNKEGSHIVAVHRYYSGLIDGKNMNSYATGQVYTDVFQEGFVLPSVPDCKGADHNRPPMEGCAESTVNLGTGRLSHEQELFAARSSQPLSLAIALYYRSLPFAPSAIGNGWSHGYETSLQSGSGNAKVFWHQGKRRVYQLYNTTYVPPVGDYSTLVKNADNTFTITEKDGLKRHFDAAGVATSVVDRNGNTLTFTYAAGKLSGATDASGRSASFAYDGSGKLATITDPRGKVYSFGYVAGQLATVTHPDDSQWSYTYGGNGLLATKADPENNLVTYTYDAGKRLTAASDPVGGSRSYTYPATAGAAGKVPDVYAVGSLPQKQFVFTEKDDQGWTYRFDTRNEAIRSKTDPLGNTTSYTYDAKGNMLSRTEPGIGTTTYTYDAKGNVLSLKNPLNQTTSFTYNAFNQVLTVSGAPGSTTYTYDPKGNLLTGLDPAGSLTQYGYDGKGNLTSVTDPRGKVTTLVYDAGNNLTSVTLPTGAETEFTYDANGNLLTVTDPLDKVTTFAYDSRNRLVSVTDPNGNVTAYAYDRNGNPSLVTDANANATAYEHNYKGQLTEIRDALGAVTALAYGAGSCSSCTGVDQLNAVTDAKSQETAFEYDPLGRLLSETDPLGLATTFGYGATRNPTSRTADGITVTYGYDALQRLTAKTHPDASTETYTYDSRGNILTAANAAVAYTFTYDGGNRLTSTADSRGYAVTYQYDPAGNRTRMTLQPGTADERVVTYVYDDGNRPTSLASAAGTFTFGYDLRNRRTTLAYPNGITAGYSYHPQTGWLTGIDYQSGWSIVGYPQHDHVGNRKQRVENGVATSYGYDDVYQLLQAAAAENYAYDAVGNRLSAGGQSYVHDAANRLLQGRAGTYAYDGRGNQIRRYLNAEQSNYWKYSWSADNRLLKAELIEGGPVVRTLTFKYDPFGRRIEKKVSDATGSKTTTYVYDGADIVLQLDNDGSATTATHTIHGPGIDEPLALVRGAESYYYHADGLGSIVTITDASRSLAQHYDYDGFGQPSALDPFENIYAYTGREWDEELGLYYYRARYYDPVEGRFISKDPIGFAGGDVNLSLPQNLWVEGGKN